MNRPPRRDVVAIIRHDGTVIPLRHNGREPQHHPAPKPPTRNNTRHATIIIATITFAILLGLLLGHWFTPLTCPNYQCT